ILLVGHVLAKQITDRIPPDKIDNYLLPVIILIVLIAAIPLIVDIIRKRKQRYRPAHRRTSARRDEDSYRRDMAPLRRRSAHRPADKTSAGDKRPAWVADHRRCLMVVPDCCAVREPLSFALRDLAAGPDERAPRTPDRFRGRPLCQPVRVSGRPSSRRACVAASTDRQSRRSRSAPGGSRPTRRASRARADPTRSGCVGGG